MSFEPFKRATFQSLIDSGILEVGDGYRAKHSELGTGGPIFLRAVHLQDSGFTFEGAQHFSATLVNKVASKQISPAILL